MDRGELRKNIVEEIDLLVTDKKKTEEEKHLRLLGIIAMSLAMISEELAELNISREK